MDEDKRYIITFFKKDSEGEPRKNVQVYKGLSESWALMKMCAKHNIPEVQVKEEDKVEGYKYIRELK